MSEFVAGFDGSSGTKKGLADSTAFVVLPVRSPAVPRLVGYWEDTGEEGWTPPRDEIAEVVDRIVGDRECVGFAADPSRWQDEVAQWEARYGPKLVTRKISYGSNWRARAWDILSESLERRIIQLNTKAPDYDLISTHLMNLRVTDLAGTPGKEHTGPRAGKVDIAAALALCASARLEVIEKQSPKQAKSWWGGQKKPCRCGCGVQVETTFATRDCKWRYEVAEADRLGLPRPAEPVYDRLQDFYGIGGPGPRVKTKRVRDGGGWKVVEDNEMRKR